MKPSSLRARLTLIILPPLLIISLIAGAWQFHNTTLRAESIFDKGLLSAAIAISRDVALSDGDAISPSTRRLLADTSGGTIFYHVFAPDGVFVTGYSTPPILPSKAPKGVTEPYYYNSVYQGEKVRVLRFQDVTLVSGIAGIFNITVWQNATRAQQLCAQCLVTILCGDCRAGDERCYRCLVRCAFGAATAFGA